MIITAIMKINNIYSTKMEINNIYSMKIIMIIMIIMNLMIITKTIKVNLIENTISIVSLNVKNIKANTCYINELLKDNDILFVQEHWLNNKEIDRMYNYLTDDRHNLIFNS